MRFTRAFKWAEQIILYMTESLALPCFFSSGGRRRIMNNQKKKEKNEEESTSKNKLNSEEPIEIPVLHVLTNTELNDP